MWPKVEERIVGESGEAYRRRTVAPTVELSGRMGRVDADARGARREGQEGRPRRGEGDVVRAEPPPLGSARLLGAVSTSSMPIDRRRRPVPSNGRLEILYGASRRQ